MPFEKLAETPLPAILHCDQNHFVVLYKIVQKNDNTMLYLADPAIGKYVFSKSELLKHWVKDNDNANQEGLVLVMQPNEAFKKTSIGNTTSNYQYLKSLFTYVKLEKKYFIKMLVLLFCSNFVLLSLPVITQKLFDDAITPKSIRFLQLIVTAQLVVISCNLIFNLLYQKTVQSIAIRLNGRILSDFVGKLFRLPISFYQKNLPVKLYKE